MVAGKYIVQKVLTKEHLKYYLWVGSVWSLKINWP